MATSLGAVAAAIVGYDVWFYIAHRLLHTKPLWSYHAKHHRKRHPNWRDTFTADKIENATIGLGVFVPLLVLRSCWWETGVALL